MRLDLLVHSKGGTEIPFRRYSQPKLVNVRPSMGDLDGSDDSHDLKVVPLPKYWWFDSPLFVTLLVAVLVVLVVGGIAFFPNSHHNPTPQTSAVTKETAPEPTGPVEKSLSNPVPAPAPSTRKPATARSATELVEQGRIAYEAHEWDKTAAIWNQLLSEYPDDRRAALIAQLTPERPITSDSPRVFFILGVMGACKNGRGEVPDMVLALTMLSKEKFEDMDSRAKGAAITIMADLKRAYHDGRMTRDQPEAAVKIFGAEVFR